jgi:hypothetical protein
VRKVFSLLEGELLLVLKDLPYVDFRRVEVDGSRQHLFEIRSREHLERPGVPVTTNGMRISASDIPSWAWNRIR